MNRFDRFLAPLVSRAGSEIGPVSLALLSEVVVWSRHLLQSCQCGVL